VSDDPVPAFRPDLRGPDADLLRHVLGHYPTGVAVITAHTEHGPVGMAMNSFTSLSLHPPLVLFCPATSSTTWPALRAVGRVAINVLSAGQEAVSRKFAAKAVDRFSEASWSVGENGAPLLHDALGWLECTVQSESAAGDHTVVIAEIERMNVHWEITEPLVFFRGRYYQGMTAAMESTEPVGTAEPLPTAGPVPTAEPVGSVENVR
jgi:3-hydroxy-9,10-secoandrosta-1,3,5(10)-triene-9,17-dione monooxygenase reductase component